MNELLHPETGRHRVGSTPRNLCVADVRGRVSLEVANWLESQTQRETRQQTRVRLEATAPLRALEPGEAEWWAKVRAADLRLAQQVGTDA